jgi:hypothetical protein
MTIKYTFFNDMEHAASSIEEGKCGTFMRYHDS